MNINKWQKKKLIHFYHIKVWVKRKLYVLIPVSYTHLQRQIEELGKFVLSRTKIPEDVFYENFDNDWYLSAGEAIKYGVAEKVIKSLDEII